MEGEISLVHNVNFKHLRRVFPVDIYQQQQCTWNFIIGKVLGKQNNNELGLLIYSDCSRWTRARQLSERDSLSFAEINIFMCWFA